MKMHMGSCFCLVSVLMWFGCARASVLDPVPDLPANLAGLKTEHAKITVYTDSEFGQMPRPYSDLSQGAETGDPNFYIEMSELLGKMGGRLVRCDPFSDTSKVTVTDEGKVEIDFSAADAICDALARAGAKPCWNIASLPEEMMDGGRPKPDLLDQFVYQVTYHWNVEQKRGIEYYEYWNEPGGLDGEMFAIAVRAAHRADPSVKVGGPAIMGCSIQVLEDAVKYCIENHVPLGFISFHLYYEMPDSFLGYVEQVEKMLDKYPETKGLEILITEWGIDAGLNGSCDTLYNAAYYSTILQTVMHKWPRVRPMHFEFRDGWDPIGPSRDLWGRWGMVTYPSLLPKPVYNAGVMWNKLADTEVRAECSDADVRVVAAKNSHRVSILVWSWPKKYERLLADSPGMRVSPLDIPVKLRCESIPFKSTGIRCRRWVVDQTHSNLGFDPYTAELQKVYDVILARTEPERGESPVKGVPEDFFELEFILPLHAVTLIELLPEERPPVNVIAQADKFRVWAGDEVKITIAPRYAEDLDLELITDPANRSSWKISEITKKPLSFRLTPPASNVKSIRYFTAWVKNRTSRAIGQAVIEIQTDNPAHFSPHPAHIDISPVTRTGEFAVDIVNKTLEAQAVKVSWDTPPGITISPTPLALEIPANSTTKTKAIVKFGKGLSPDRYPVNAHLRATCELDTITLPVNLPLQSPKVKGSISIDGNLSEWERIPSVKVASSTDFDGHSYREWGGPGDISGRIWSQWDEQNLYLAFRVMDDEHVQKVTTWEMKNWDSVHVGFDFRRDSTNPKEFFDESDCDYVFGYMDGKAYAYRHWGAKRAMGYTEGVKIAARKERNIISYEIAMSWKEEAVPYAKGIAGETIGCSVYFRDYDEGKHTGEMRWGRGLAWDEKRPALFNSIQLTE